MTDVTKKTYAHFLFSERKQDAGEFFCIFFFRSLLILSKTCNFCDVSEFSDVGSGYMTGSTEISRPQSSESKWDLQSSWKGWQYRAEAWGPSLLMLTWGMCLKQHASGMPILWFLSHACNEKNHFLSKCPKQERKMQKSCESGKRKIPIGHRWSTWVPP